MRSAGWITLLLVVVISGPNAWAKNCKKGQPCGNSCISWNKTCRIGGGTSYNYTPPAPATRSLYTPAPTPSQIVSPPRAAQSTKKIDVTPHDSNAESQFAQTDAAFVYALPSRSAKRIRRLAFGEQVSVYETLGEWSRISPTNAGEEWVQQIYLGTHAP